MMKRIKLAGHIVLVLLGWLLLCCVFEVRAATLDDPGIYTEIRPGGGGEPSLLDILDSVLGDSYYRVPDIWDHFLLSAGQPEIVGLLPSFSSSNNSLQFQQEPGTNLWAACIDTTLPHAINACSDPSRNGGVDYLATFRSFLDENLYILAFEDWDVNKTNPAGLRSDRDFQDLIVMVRAVSPVEPVPEPATFLVFFSCMLVALIIGRKRVGGN